MKSERAKNPMGTERRASEPGKKDKMDQRQPMPRHGADGLFSRRSGQHSAKMSWP